MRKTCTPAERQEFFQLLADPSYEEQIRQISETYEAVPLNGTILDADTTRAVWEAIRKGAPAGETPVRKIPVTRRWWAAAAILLVAGAAAWFWRQSAPQQNELAGGSTHLPVIAPGTSGAVLTLDNGKTIVLDSLQNGLIAKQAGANVLLQNGQLAYNADSGKTQIQRGEEKISYNTMTTPRGKQFQLTLPDGTKVWLNAASSLRYPTAFVGNRREVQLTGEAYFEVAPLRLRSGQASTSDPERSRRTPFIVNVDSKADIEVMGTHFNVNAYRDESFVKTTLLEGKVVIVPKEPAHNLVVLEPGHECVIEKGKVVVNKVDTESAVAWINGKFNFKSADLAMVLRQLARWYDVDIRYDEKINARFSGSMYRSADFYELLKIIEFTSNVAFTVNQKTITVSPK